MATRRFVLYGTVTLVLAGCTTTEDDTETLDFFSTYVERNDDTDVTLDFLEGDEVTVAVRALDEGTVSTELLHKDSKLLSETTDGPDRDTFKVHIDRRENTFHRLIVTTNGTDATVNVTVQR